MHRMTSVGNGLGRISYPFYISCRGVERFIAEELSKKHSDIDQKISDILHYIELCETNDNEATDLVELLRVCRENRRDIKDELQRIKYFQTGFGTNANVIRAKQALKSIKGLETRKYKPRKYEELFENCVLKGRRLQRDDIRTTATCWFKCKAKIQR